jgi:hypothetical protein
MGVKSQVSSSSSSCLKKKFFLFFFIFCFGFVILALK